MARNRVRDERQGDLFGAPPPPANPARRAAPPKPCVGRCQHPSRCRGHARRKATRPAIDELPGWPAGPGAGVFGGRGHSACETKARPWAGKGTSIKGPAKGHRRWMRPCVGSAVS